MSGKRKGYNYQKLDIDFSILRGPLNLPEEGVLQIVKCIQSGTNEIKETLLFEIDIIYECRVCRGLFRSLTNLLAHKRVYCQEKYKDTKLEFVPSYTENETVVVQPEAPEESAKEDLHKENAETDKSNTTDGARSVIEQMSEGKFEGNSEPYKFYTKAVERQQQKDAERSTAVVTLKRISCNSNAVYQSCQNTGNDTDTSDKKCRQSNKDSEDEDDEESGDEKESPKYEKKDQSGAKDEHPDSAMTIDNVEVVTIQPEAASGPLRMNLRQRSGGEVTTPIIISLSQRADCEVKTKTCLICNTQYSSLKTLHFHMMNCHSEKRTIFPCLYCAQEFTQMFGVTRHLSRVHHKSKETIEKLRLTLKKKAYSKPLEDIKDSKLDKYVEKNSSEKVVKKREEGVSRRTLHKITMHTVRGGAGGAGGALQSYAQEGASSNFKCIHCSKVFKKQESLDRHASFCFTSQATMGQLSGTELPKNLHGNMEETMEMGSSTDMGRWSTSDLSTEDAKQLSTMINEETLTCLKCDQSYSNISNLHRHAVRHLGRTRFKCRLCQYTAYNRSECKTHLRRVHPGRVFDEEELNNYIVDLEQERSKGSSRSRSESPAEELSECGKAKQTSGKPATYMDHLTTLRTRSGLYIKPRFAVKRKTEDGETIEEERTNSEKRSRTSMCEEDIDNDSNVVTEDSERDGKDSDDVFISDSADSQDSTHDSTQDSAQESTQDSCCSENISNIDSLRGGIANYSHSFTAIQNAQMGITEQKMSLSMSEQSGSTLGNPNFPRVPSLIIKKVSISESCILQQQSMHQDGACVENSQVEEGKHNKEMQKVETQTVETQNVEKQNVEGKGESQTSELLISESQTFKGKVKLPHIHLAEDHLARPILSSPSSSRSRDTSPDILLEHEQHTPKETVQRDWADVWESKSEDGEEEFLGFRLVSDAHGCPLSKKGTQSVGSMQHHQQLKHKHIESPGVYEPGENKEMGKMDAEKSHDQRLHKLATINSIALSILDTPSSKPATTSSDTNTSLNASTNTSMNTFSNTSSHKISIQTQDQCLIPSKQDSHFAVCKPTTEKPLVPKVMDGPDVQKVGDVLRKTCLGSHTASDDVTGYGSQVDSIDSKVTQSNLDLGRCHHQGDAMDTTDTGSSLSGHSGNFDVLDASSDSKTENTAVENPTIHPLQSTILESILTSTSKPSYQGPSTVTTHLKDTSKTELKSDKENNTDYNKMETDLCESQAPKTSEQIFTKHQNMDNLSHSSQMFSNADLPMEVALTEPMAAEIQSLLKCSSESDNEKILMTDDTDTKMETDDENTNSLKHTNLSGVTGQSEDSQDSNFVVTESEDQLLDIAPHDMKITDFDYLEESKPKGEGQNLGELSSGAKEPCHCMKSDCPTSMKVSDLDQDVEMYIPQGSEKLQQSVCEVQHSVKTDPQSYKVSDKSKRDLILPPEGSANESVEPKSDVCRLETRNAPIAKVKSGSIPETDSQVQSNVTTSNIVANTCMRQKDIDDKSACRFRVPSPDQKKDVEVQSTSKIKENIVDLCDATAKNIDMDPGTLDMIDSTRSVKEQTHSQADATNMNIPQIVIESEDEKICDGNREENSHDTQDTTMNPQTAVGVSNAKNSDGNVSDVRISDAKDGERSAEALELCGGNWKSGFLIPEIIICPPSVSACSEESDELNENLTATSVSNEEIDHTKDRKDHGDEGVVISPNEGSTVAEGKTHDAKHAGNVIGDVGAKIPAEMKVVVTPSVSTTVERHPKSDSSDSAENKLTKTDICNDEIDILKDAPELLKSQKMQEAKPDAFSSVSQSIKAAKKDVEQSSSECENSQCPPTASQHYCAN